MRFLKRIGLIIGSMGISFFGFTNTILEITNEFEYQYVGEYLDIYKDVAGTTSITEVLYKETWQAQSASKFAINVKIARLWIKLKVKNQTNHYQELSLVLENPLLEKVQFYSFQEDNLLDTSLQMGNAFPFNQRSVQHRFPIYTFQLAPYQEKTIYGSLMEDSHYTNIHLKLFKQAHLLSALQKDLIYKILLISPLFLLTVISILFLIATPKFFNLFFALKCIGALLFLLGLEGVGFEYLWPNEILVQKSFSLSYNFYHLFLALSLLSFFKMDKKSTPAKLLYADILLQLLTLIYIFKVGQLIDIELLLPLEMVLSVSSICSFIAMTLACLNFYNSTKNKIMLSIIWLFLLQLVVAVPINIFWLINIHYQDYISSFELFAGVGAIQTAGMLLMMITYYHDKSTAFEKVELQLAQKQNEALQNLLTGQENERKRLSRALHDGLSIRMLQVKQGLDTIKGDLNTNRFTTIIQEIDKIHQDIRKFSHALNPTVLQEFGLKKAINDIIFKIELNNPELDIQFEYPIDLGLTKEQEKHFYYIIQELLNNTIKYSKSNYVYIEFRSLKDRTLLYYFDNGKGYDPNNLITTGIGLNNIRSRVALLNGEFKILPRKPNGMEHTIYVSI